VRLAEKIAIVTGSGRGIGKAIAECFAREGAAVALVDRQMDRATANAQAIATSGGVARAFKADVSIRSEVLTMVEDVKREFGTVHVLVNNAGITCHRPLLEMTEDEWDLVMNNNLKSQFLCTQAVLPLMISQKYGKIINMSSSSGIERTTARPTMANYAAAKAGVVQLTKVTSKVGGPHNVNVNAIAPGLIDTEIMHMSQTPEQVERLVADKKKAAVLNRIGQPEDIANLALFLATDESSFITAQVICCDGGTADRL
jgi:3-oxoacyl-[acyl-carrier protein] reductase